MTTLANRSWVAGLALLLLALCAAPGRAASATEIDADVTATMRKFHANVPSAYDLTSRAAGILVFPSVVKAGFGVGGEYGEGALYIGARPVAYYNTISASIGFQLGA